MPAAEYEQRQIAYMLIGSLVHRAVLWPFVRPKTGAHLDQFKDQRHVTRYASMASSTLERALRPLVDDVGVHDLDAAIGLISVEGPWGSDQFESHWSRLAPSDRSEVLDELDRLVFNAASGVSDFVRSVGITGGYATCVWSEVPLFAINGFFRTPSGEEDRLRADLVVWRERGDIDVLELKIGNASPPEWVLQRDREQVKRYVREVRRRVSPSQRVQGRLLYIDRSRNGSRMIKV